MAGLPGGLRGQRSLLRGGNPPTSAERRVLSPRRPWLWILVPACLLVVGAVVRDLVLALGEVDLTQDITPAWAYGICALGVFADTPTRG